MHSSQIRKRIILDIISQENISSQEKLQEKLQQKGIETTQATLSRDLKALHIIKVPGEGYRPQPTSHHTVPASPQSIMSVEFSGQIGIVKTQTGFAPAVAAHLDLHPARPIMGTIAGDDTVFLALRKGFSQEDALTALEKTIPGISAFLIK